MGSLTRQTLLKHKYEDNVKGLVFFFLWNVYFPLVLAHGRAVKKIINHG